MTATVELRCTPADVSAAALGVSWNGPLPEILADTVIPAPAGGGHLHLAVIGGSHVVTVHRADGTAAFREEVSCTAQEAVHPLPTLTEHPDYRLDTRTRQLSGDDFREQADALLSDGDWFIVRFPGPGRHHLTALRGGYENGAWCWDTRHLYPEESTIVSTRSTYRP